MRGITHAVSVIPVWLEVAPRLGVTHPVLLVAGTGVVCAVAFLPDVDVHSSHAAQALGPMGRLVSSGVLAGAPKVVRAVARRTGPLRPFLTGLHHRGATHWISTWLVLGSVVATVTTLSWLGWAVAIGGITHIVGDACTVRGVKAAGPLSDATWRVPLIRFRSGGAFERIVVMPLCVLAAGWSSASLMLL